MLTYTITVQNTGTEAGTFTVADTFNGTNAPTATEPAGNGWTGTANNWTNTWSLSVAAGVSDDITYSYTVVAQDAGKRITNGVEVNADLEEGSDPGTETDVTGLTLTYDDNVDDSSVSGMPDPVTGIVYGTEQPVASAPFPQRPMSSWGGIPIATQKRQATRLAIASPSRLTPPCMPSGRRPTSRPRW